MELRTRFAIVVLGLVAALAVASPAAAATPATGVLRTGLPNRILTPGALNPAVTPATIHRTICVSGWTATIRPPSTYTTRLKGTQLVTYGFVDRAFGDYEEDHLISLELGGDPLSTANLWPEPHHIRIANAIDVGSYSKDAFENYLRREVCAGRMSLTTAQRRIAVNWVYYWRQWKSSAGMPVPNPAPTASPAPNVAPAPAPAPAAGAIAAATAAGATAVCSDGTWSNSQSRSGTCSGHGGVYWWTAIVGPAGPG